ncbi:NMCC_0638 family (lipo)protein [Lysobacter sp. cf310]|uniref:NMCC_0638 family (lipo)protein n=1 Tax=Lysobacter sp. cf310 TaxID=1761790 RepID=UPI001113DAFD|nr:hypothetical protein [Lysobacter sp. cf310]
MQIFVRATIAVLAMCSLTAGATPPTYDEPTEIFLNYCIPHFISTGQELDQRMPREGRRMLSEQVAPSFLEHTPGKAWLVRASETSMYVVSIADDRTCRVYAREADRDVAWSNFDKASSFYFKPLVPIPLPPQEESGPRRTKGLYFGADPKKSTPVMLITTDSSGAKDQFAIRFSMYFLVREDVERILKTGKAD